MADEGTIYELFNEQLLLIATVLGAVATLPTLVEFLVERRKRNERVSLSLEDEGVDELVVRLAGLDELLAENADIIDAARHPAAYRGGNVGNEILVIGPPMSGKKSLARRMAKDAKIERLITVHNPRNADALASAKNLLKRYRNTKVMLLIPNIDRVFEAEDDELRNELDALIDRSSERENILVVGTACRFKMDSELDNLFGIKLLLPGTVQQPEDARVVDEAAYAVHRKVAEFYLDDAVKEGWVIAGWERGELIERILNMVANPAEVEDILNLAKTSARHRQRIGQTKMPEITAEIVDRAIHRVIVNATVA